MPGIGPSTDDKMLQTRKSYGAHESVDDLLAIQGIGQKRLDKMRKYLTVGKISRTKAAYQALSSRRHEVPQALKDMGGKGRKKQAVPRALPKSVDAWPWAT